MSTVLSANIEMKDPEKFKEYSPKAIASMEPYGGKLMLRAKVAKVVHGPIPHQVIALFEFPDSAAIILGITMTNTRPLFHYVMKLQSSDLP